MATPEAPRDTDTDRDGAKPPWSSPPEPPEAQPSGPEQAVVSPAQREQAEVGPAAPEQAEVTPPEPQFHEGEQVQAEGAQRDVAEPEVAEPEVAEPEVAEPEVAEPGLEQPGPEEPRPTGPAPEEPLPDQPRPAPEPEAEPVLYVTPAPPSLRERLIPRSVLGFAALVLAFAVGAAFSGAVFYSYYEFKKDRTEKQVASFIERFEKRYEDALATIEAEGHNARAEIQRELEPLRKTRAEGQTLEALVKKVEPSMFFVSTLDEAGQPSVGSAFAVASDGQQTLLLTSYTTIKAATRQPGPALRVRKGGQDVRATLWTWHEDKDLALITLDRANVPTLTFGSDQLRPGERLFAVSALGGAGGSVTQGLVADVSAIGVQHDAAIGQAFQGGPLVNSDGAVLAVASRSYSPLGFTSDQVFFAPFARAACERVLRCGPGAPGAGDRGAPARR